MGGLALHFPITAGGTKHQHSLQERVRASAWPACLHSCLPAGPRSCLTSTAPCCLPAALPAALPSLPLPQVEVDATLQRQGNGLQLNLHQLNGVLRLRQD